MNKFEDIQNDINSMKIGADDSLYDILNRLHDQLFRAGNARWTSQELEKYIFSDDVLEDQNTIQKDTAYWNEIRNIQKSILIELGGN